MEIQDILIKNMIALRKSRGLTQIELGQMVSYSDKTISKWENGDSCPTVEAVLRLARFYGVTVDEMLSPDMKTEQKNEEKTDDRTRYSKLAITLLAVIAVWTVATVLFFSFNLVSLPYSWLPFIYALPATFITVTVFNTLWGNVRYNYLFVSLLLWTALASVFLSLLKYGAWSVFILGIPVQVAIILWSKLKKK